MKTTISTLLLTVFTMTAVNAQTVNSLGQTTTASTDAKITQTVKPQVSSDLVMFEKDGKYGFAKVVIPAKYDKVNDYVEGLAAVEIGGKWGFIDKSGKEIVPAYYDGVYNFSNGICMVKMQGYFGFIDKTGKEIVACKYQNAFSFVDGKAPVQLDGKWGKVDMEGNEFFDTK